MLMESKNKIEYLNSDWSYHGESDPGITLVELFVWLKSVQHDYISSVSPMVGIKFLNLLGIELQKNRGSRVLIEVFGVAEDINVPKRTKWMSQELIFENPERVCLTSAEILSVKFENPEFEIEEDYYRFNGVKKFFLFGKNLSQNFISENDTVVNENLNVREFEIRFDKALPKGKTMNLYFEVFLESGFKRNPVSKEFEPIAKISWEYYGIENKRTGWQKLGVSDSTNNFLFSGVVRLTINGEMLPVNGFFCVRIRLLESDYDFPPQVTKITPNIFEVVQEDTHCESVIIKKRDMVKIKHEKKNKRVKYISKNVALSTHLSLYGESDLYIKHPSGGWVEETGFNIQKDTQKGVATLIIEEVDFIKEFQPKDEVVMLVSYSEYIKPNIFVGNGTGFSAQMFDADYGNPTLYENFKLMVAEKRDNTPVFEIWNRVGDFFSSKKTDKHFVFEENINKIVFGDHIHGMAPRKGINNIRINSISFTSQEKSNIKSGIDCVKSENEVLKKCLINQITEAIGGKKNESVMDAQKRNIDSIGSSKRALTIEDYEKIVKATPGLIFKNVTILPGFSANSISQGGNQKIITIAARCAGQTYLPKCYIKNIKNHVEKYRLLGTKVEVIGPEYIDIIVNAKIFVNSSFKPKDMIFENKIESFFKRVNSKMGQPIFCGELFGEVEKLKCVSFIEYLKIIPIGAKDKKTEEQNILIPPNGIYRLKDIEVNYVIDAGE